MNTDTSRRIMRPSDAAKYLNVSPQGVREGMKAKTLDIGFITNPSGKRVNYYIIPEKVFAYLGKPVPTEWQTESTQFDSSLGIFN